MSIFGSYFVITFLKSLGWPKRKSLFDSTAILDTFVVDSTIEQMIDWAAALGACRPKLALKVIAWMFQDKDWDGADAPKIADFVNKAKNEVWVSDDNKAPHEILASPKLSKHFGKIIEAKELKDERMRKMLEQVCLGGLLWGLSNPELFKSWFETNYRNNKKKLPFMQKAGVEIDSLPTLEDFLKECEEMLSGYEREIDPLPAIPSKLLADARSLGIMITD